MYSQVINGIRKQSYTTENVNLAAEQILKVSSPVTIPIKIIEICKNMGFSVYRQSLPDNICGYIMINGELKEKLQTDRIISVNERESNKRRRFTVAHELGHYLFDFDPEKSIQYFNKFEIDHFNGEPAEDRANRFAAELLMPARETREMFEELRGNSENSLYDIIQIMSDRFLVPPKAVEVRIRKELGLI